ncbi:MAG: hypothetical protein HY934_00775 [Candidatus Firestonebacteria bacterium]|nr:hypothetical protein [Candidatus Firestonebacteria bacterium]
MINIKQEALISKGKKTDSNNITFKIHKIDKKQINIMPLTNTEQFNKRADKLLSRWSCNQINSLKDCKKLRDEMNKLVNTFIYFKT